MKIVIIGSKGMSVPDLEQYLPSQTTEIVTGGADGVDASAKEYAEAHEIKLTEFLPDHEQYGEDAVIQRNLAMIRYAEMVLAFWNGESRGTKELIDQCNEMEIPIRVFV